jgi:hypothetical protein
MASWGHLQPLSTEFYTLLRYGLFLVLLIHLPFLGNVIGGSAVSLFLNYLGTEKRDPSYLRFSQELMRTVLISKSTLFIFGLVPLLLVWFIFARVLFDASPLPWQFWAVILAVLFSGFALLSSYRSARGRATDLSPMSAAIGAAGLLAVLLAFFLFSAGYGILFNPGKLPLLQKHVQFLLSWNGVVKFLLFVTFFFGMTGGVILLLGAREAEGNEGPDSDSRQVVCDFGVILTFLATLVLPVFVLFDLVTLPENALSAELFATSAVVLLLSLAVCLVLSFSSGKGKGRLGPWVLTLYVLIFFTVLLHDRLPGHAGAGGRGGTCKRGASERTRCGRPGGSGKGEGRIRENLRGLPPVRHPGRRSTAFREGSDLPRGCGSAERIHPESGQAESRLPVDAEAGAPGGRDRRRGSIPDRKGQSRRFVMIHSPVTK